MRSESQLPGGVAVSDVDPYAWPARDGMCGGAPHVHLACTEAYVVTAGRGAVQTLTVDGPEEVELEAGSIVWFTPGVVHRMVDREDMRVMIVMENSGLTERGDAVLTFPREILGDAEAYARAARLPEADDPSLDGVARARRDLAVEGFLQLRDAVQGGDTRALSDFYEAAVALVSEKVRAWEDVWRAGPLAQAERTGRDLAAITAGDASYLTAGRVSLARPSRLGGYGMCGRRDEYTLPGALLPANVA